jgi:hypothetical protein
MLLALALSAPVASAATEPAEGYEQFAPCPDEEESATSVVCVRSEITGGHLQVGNKDVPIKQPLTLAGGVNNLFGEFTPGPGGGLSPVKQEVPGGIVGLTGLDWLVNFLNLEALKLYAITELAGPPTNFNLTTVTIPIKAHMINPVLGNNCYVGSDSDPIVLDLTTGTTDPPPPNEPITGVFPKISLDPLGIIHFDDGTFVDNAFSAPGANGCVLNLLGFIPISLDNLVNQTSGLPAPAGTNEAVQEYDLEYTSRENVYP